MKLPFYFHLIHLIIYWATNRSMKLFKFRSFEKVEFILDIVINERLYCAPHKDLNDPFEGIFSFIEWKGGGIVRNVVRPVVRPVVTDLSGNYPVKVFKSLAEVPSLGGNIRVCSLSKELTDIRMWTHYAANHTGCVIEIDIEDEPRLFKVTYAPGLKKFAKRITGETQASEILSFKTDHWAYEKEYRIITNEDYYQITGKISAVYLGTRIQDIHKQLIINNIKDKIPVYETKINLVKVDIRPSKRIK